MASAEDAGHDGAAAYATGLTLAGQGRHVEAEAALRRALAALEHIEARDPRREAVLRGLASLYASQGRRAEAARIESALAAPPAMLSRGVQLVPPAQEP